MEAVSSVCIMLRSDIINLGRLTTEPSEHSIVQLGAIERDSTVNDLISIVKKMARL